MKDWKTKLRDSLNLDDNQSSGHTLKEKDLDRRLIPTRRPTIDFITTGGFPNYGISIIAGVKHSGKTTLAFQAASEFEGQIGFLDTEFSTDSAFIDSLGVDSNRVERWTAKNLEEMSEILTNIIPHYKVIVWDSISNIASDEEQGKSAKDRTRANAAIVFSTQVKRWAQMLANHGSSLIIVSHVSDNQERLNKYDDKYIIPGGHRLHHNSYLTLMMFPSTKEKGDKDIFSQYDSIYGRASRIVCEKNKSGAPLRKGKILNVYGEGFSVQEDTFNAGVSLGVISKKGSWYYYGDVKLGQGEAKAKQFFQDNPKSLEEVGDTIYKEFIGRASEFTADNIEEFADEKGGNDSK